MLLPGWTYINETPHPTVYLPKKSCDLDPASSAAYGVYALKKYQKSGIS